MARANLLLRHERCNIARSSRTVPYDFEEYADTGLAYQVLPVVYCNLHRGNCPRQFTDGFDARRNQEMRHTGYASYLLTL
jgi:hypothetical protein